MQLSAAQKSAFSRNSRANPSSLENSQPLNLTPVAPLMETADGIFDAAWFDAVQPFSPLSGRADAPANATPSSDMSFARSSPPPEISSSLSDVG